MPPFVVELFILYQDFRLSYSLQQMFLAWMSLALVNAWFISIVLSLALRYYFSEQISLRGMQLRVLSNLPKVLLSYALLLVLISLSAVAVPLIVFLFFFVWAPFYCAAEAAVPGAGAKRGNGLDTEEIDDEDYFGVNNSALKQFYVFKEKMIIELGFARSSQLVARNPSATFEALALLWCAHVVPIAAVDLVSSPFGGGISLFFKSLLSGLSGALALGICAGVFLRIIPEHARKELEPRRAVNLAMGEEEKSKVTFGPLLEQKNHGRRRLVFLLGLLALAATYIDYLEQRSALELPEWVMVEHIRAEVPGDRVSFDIELSDLRSNYRWFNSSAFRLELTGQDSGGVEADSELLKPDKVEIFSDDGRVLSEKDLVGYSGFARVRLEYAPEKGADKGKNMVLYYSPFGDRSRVIHSGRRGVD
jgi:hypothetical protein